VVGAWAGAQVLGVRWDCVLFNWKRLLELGATAAIPEGMAAAPPNIAVLSRCHMYETEAGPEADQPAEASQSPPRP